MQPLLLRSIAACVLALPASADIVWTGATSNDVFDESNWDLSNSAVTVIDPNVTIEDDVVVTNAPAPLELPNVTGQQRFQLGDGFVMTLTNSTLIVLGNDGIGGAAGTSVGPTVRLVQGSSLTTYFIVNRTLLEVDATSTATFGGPATPINGSDVDITFGATLAFLAETPQDYLNEHLSKTTVDGAPAVDGVNIQVVSDGGAGCIVTVIAPVVGTTYCSPQPPNSSGASGIILALGSDVAAANNLTLRATQLPLNEFGYFLAARAQGFIPMAGGSQGNLCLSIPIARFIGSLQSSGAAGEMQHAVDLTAIPLTPTAAVVAGEMWSFQAWYRDVNPSPTSNFTDGVELTFQ